MEELKKEILESWRIVADALEGFVLPMRYALRDVGKRCSERFIYKQMARQTDISYLNFLAVFKLWMAAIILSGNRRGAELILHHVEIFVRRVKDIAKAQRTEFPNISEIERSAMWQRVFADLRVLENI